MIAPLTRFEKEIKEECTKVLVAIGLTVSDQFASSLFVLRERRHYRSPPRFECRAVRSNEGDASQQPDEIQPCLEPVQ